MTSPREILVRGPNRAGDPEALRPARGAAAREAWPADGALGPVAWCGSGA